MHLDMEECFFKDVLNCTTDSGDLSTAGPRRIETVIKCSKVYKDGISTNLEPMLDKDSSLSIRCHRDCVSTYTSRLHVTRHLKRASDENVPHDSPKRRRSFDSNFSFDCDCLFCGSNCDVVKPTKNPGRWRKAYIFRQIESIYGGNTVKEYLLRKCEE